MPNTTAIQPMRVQPRPEERGGVLLAVVVILMPIVLILGSFTSTMGARTSRLQADLSDERALLAAESGVDLAIFEARRGTLTSGVRIGRSIGALSCLVTPTHLGSDGRDNDGDLAIDERDEDVFQLLSEGSYRGTVRRLAAYVGKVMFLPSFNAAFTVGNPATTLTIGGTPRVDGHNYRLDGTLAGSGDTFGIGAVPPATPLSVLSQLTLAEASRVDGIGGPPSIGVSPIVDLNQVVEDARNAATWSLSNDRYTVLPSGPGIYYREGNLRLSGNMVISGLLVVTGRLQITGTVRIRGVVIVLGDIDHSTGTLEVLGSLVGGPASGAFRIMGTADIKYSTEAIDLANQATGRYVAFNGWQELSRR